MKPPTVFGLESSPQKSTLQGIASMKPSDMSRSPSLRTPSGAEDGSIPANIFPAISEALPCQEPAAYMLQLIIRHHQAMASGISGPASPGPANAWITGPCGSGKTHLAREAAKVSGLPWIRADLAQYAVAGQSGRSLDLILHDLAGQLSPAVAPERQLGIIIVEGLDCELTNKLNDRARALQNELAAVIENDVYLRVVNRNQRMSSRQFLWLITVTDESTAVPRTPIGFNKSRPTDVAWHEQPRTQLLQLGVQLGLLERCPHLVRIPALSAEDLQGALLRTGLGGWTGAVNLFAETGLRLEMEPAAAAWIGERAAQSGKGIHGLSSVISGFVPSLLALTVDLDPAVGGLRITRDYLAARAPLPEFLPGGRRQMSEVFSQGPMLPTRRHPDFHPESLPRRPARPLATAASSDGRLATRDDLARWLLSSSNGCQPD